MDYPLSILFEDNHCLVVAKPAPLLTQGVPAISAAGAIPTLESLVKNYLKERYHKKGNVYLGIPHRLDRPVSGAIVFARNTKAARRLAEQFQKHEVTKIYWAAVDGKVDVPEGEWEDWLLKIPEQARAAVVDPDTAAARRALLSYRRLAVGEDYSLLEIRPKTGRMHQIRVQAAVRGHSVRGDVLYGSRLPFGPAADKPRDRIIALHAYGLEILHPIRYEPMTFVAPLPPAWQELRLTALAPFSNSAPGPGPQFASDQ